MAGTGLSRWTLAFFGSGLVWLLAAEALMVAGFGYPAAELTAPETLIVVHMVAIGWLSLLVSGALFQFVPVLVASPLKGGGLTALALVLINAGLACLLCGFAGLAGLIAAPAPALPAGALLLLAGFALVVVALAATLWAARPLPLPARFVAVGLIGLIATALLGNVFTFVLAGFLGGDAAFALLLNGVPLHAAFGLGTWLSLVAIGVSYRLFAMFLLAPDAEPPAMRRVLIAAGLGLAVLVAAVPFAIASAGGVGAMLAVAGLAGLVAIGLYGRDVAKLYRSRKRRAVELNMQAALTALGMLGLSALLLVGLLAIGQLESRVGAAIYLFAFGWLGGLGLAKLYKIVPFLTWLECYAPKLGKEPTPRVQDLVDERNARPWFALYFLCVLMAAALLLAGWNGAFRLAVLMQLLATLGLVRHFYLARRLGPVPAAQKGGLHPHLFFANSP